MKWDYSNDHQGILFKIRLGRRVRVASRFNQRFPSCRYIELNPVRVGIVKSPECYPWSSYGFNALDEEIAFLVPHKLYCELDTTDALRQMAYRSLFEQDLKLAEIDSLPVSAQSGALLGSEQFRGGIEQRLKI